MLDKHSVNQFKNIYFKVYGFELSDEKAYELASNLLNLYRAVYSTEGKNMNQKYETKIQSSKN